MTRWLLFVACGVPVTFALCCALDALVVGHVEVWRNVWIAAASSVVASPIASVRP